ncbi:MAG: hypothetical protein AAGA57_03265 [Planctomycetota bacterium]
MAPDPIAFAARRRGRPHGFTLLEVLIGSVILAAIVLTIGGSITAGQQQGLSGLEQAYRMELVENTADRVLALPYNDPEGDTAAGPDTGETTALLFDALDDYHGWSESAGSLTTSAGAALPTPYQGLSRSVTVADASVSVATMGGSIAGKEVTVTVTDADGVSAVVRRFVAEPSS